jgi:hypothetical protein
VGDLGISDLHGDGGQSASDLSNPVVAACCGEGLLVAERQFRKVQGYREIPTLLTALANTVSKKGVAEDVKVA